MATTAAVSLNTLDLPEVEMRAQRSKSRHWAMRSGPRRLVYQDQNQWCTRSELLVSIPEQEIVDEVVEQKILTGECAGPYFLDDESHDDDGHDDPRIIGPSAWGMCPRPTLDFGEILAASGSPSQKRSRRQQQVLSASWIVPATSGRNAKKSTVKEDTEKHEDEGEWPTLRRPGAAAAAPSTALSFLLLSDRQKEEKNSEVSSECCASESWEVCSNVSSMASSWAVLEGEQRLLKDVEETKSSSWADVLKEVGLGRKDDDAEGQVAAAAGAATTEAPAAAANLPGGGVRTTPAAPVTFADAVRRGGDGGSGSTTIVEGGKDTTTKKTEDDVQQKKKAPAPAAPATAAKKEAPVNEADDLVFYHDDDADYDWDGFVCTSPQYAAPEKDNRGGGRTKAAKGPRSVVQQERVAASRARRTAQRAKDRGMAKDRGIAMAT